MQCSPCHDLACVAPSVIDTTVITNRCKVPFEDAGSGQWFWISKGTEKTLTAMQQQYPKVKIYPIKLQQEASRYARQQQSLTVRTYAELL